MPRRPRSQTVDIIRATIAEFKLYDTPRHFNSIVNLARSLNLKYTDAYNAAQYMKKKGVLIRQSGTSNTDVMYTMDFKAAAELEEPWRKR